MTDYICGDCGHIGNNVPGFGPPTLECVHCGAENWHRLPNNRVVQTKQ